MSDSDTSLQQTAELRHQAEAQWRQRSTHSDISPTDEAQRLLHELEVHQIELEMQNAELRRAQEDLAASHARYFDLFDLAPVGYLTVDTKDLVLEANLAAANLLGVERSQLIGRPMAPFIYPDDQDIYYLHHRQLSGAPQAQVCELRLRRRDGTAGWVQMQSVLATGSDGAQVRRVTLSDLTERKLAEEQNRHLSRRLVEAQEEERRSLARELHDGAGQVLTSMFLDLGALARNAADNPDAGARIEKLRHEMKGLMSELHALSANLYPAGLRRAGLVGALQGLLDSLQDTAGPHFRMQTWGLEGQRLPPEYEIAMYRVVQEAINNALRHAHARHIDVILQLQENRLVVIIEDDGAGFDVDANHLQASGLGMISMRERSEILGGRLTIESKPGAGTTVHVEVPV